MKKDILLVIPRGRSESMRGFALGPAFVAAKLLSEGITAGAADCNAVHSKNSGAKTPRELIGKMLAENRPEIVGISATAPTYLAAIEAISAIRDFYSGSGNQMPKIVIGGPLVSAYDYRNGKRVHSAGEVLGSNSGICAAVRGEGENTASELFKSLLAGGAPNGIPGVSWRIGDEIVHNPDRAPEMGKANSELDNLPFPGEEVRRIFEWERFGDVYSLGGAFSGMKSTILHTARGCIGNCTFCFSRREWGNLRHYSPEKVAAWIQDLSGSGFRGAFFEDDYTTASCRKNGFRFHKILELIISLKNSGNISQGIIFGCGTRADGIDGRLASLMKKAGFEYVYFGLESASEGIRGNVRKLAPKTRNADYERAINTANRAGIRAMVSLMFGLPGETIETIRQTVEFVQKFPPKMLEACVSIASLYPGTPLSAQFADGEWGAENIADANTSQYAKEINFPGLEGAIAEMPHGMQAVISPIILRNGEIRNAILRAIENMQKSGHIGGLAFYDRRVKPDSV